MIQIHPAGRLKLAVLASGRGSNFDAIYTATQDGRLNADIKVLVSDKAESLALQKARQRKIPAYYLDPSAYSSRSAYETELVSLLRQHQVEVVALAGYMRLVGKVMLEEFRHCIVNIHPALLPAFPGLNAQRQALEYGVKFSGCTVHLVDEGMDTGPIIMQRVVPVYDYDDEDSLSTRILEQEHQVYWQSLQLMAEGKLYLDGRRVIVRT
ncbi:MAG TPA: phosphoribosylglycinamide formyltransferase [Syntrophomonadaceae bacterium]|nr:phosphoribosylglycinamide formyltransferase [Syntrophomonadaceae bacterium]HQA07364.1 phosphoribosylglycinamide formyltransferase [Syntrophomonadaceae bacterium]HQE23783.1 phosphoribosylglycinamide formyltransferase [Syntrophomonadaceae bacterium]